MNFCLRIVLLIFIALVATGRSHAHSFYSDACCTEKDCKPAEPGSVQRTMAGWLVDNQYFVPDGDERIKDIPPGHEDAPRLHVCYYATGGVRCLYVGDTES